MQVPRASHCPQALQSLEPGIQPASGALVTSLLQSLLTQSLPLGPPGVTEHIWMVSRWRNAGGVDRKSQGWGPATGGLPSAPGPSCTRGGGAGDGVGGAGGGWWGVNAGAARKHMAPCGLPGTVPAGALLLGSWGQQSSGLGPSNPPPAQGWGSQEGMAWSWLYFRLQPQLFCHRLWKGVAWCHQDGVGAWLKRKVDRPQQSWTGPDLTSLTSSEGS